MTITTVTLIAQGLAPLSVVTADGHHLAVSIAPVGPLGTPTQEDVDATIFDMQTIDVKNLANAVRDVAAVYLNTKTGDFCIGWVYPPQAPTTLPVNAVGAVLSPLVKERLPMKGYSETMIDVDGTSKSLPALQATWPSSNTWMDRVPLLRCGTDYLPLIYSTVPDPVTGRALGYSIARLRLVTAVQDSNSHLVGGPLASSFNRRDIGPLTTDTWMGHRHQGANGLGSNDQIYSTDPMNGAAVTGSYWDWTHAYLTQPQNLAALSDFFEPATIALLTDPARLWSIDPHSMPDPELSLEWLPTTMRVHDTLTIPAGNVTLVHGPADTAQLWSNRPALHYDQFRFSSQQILYALATLPARMTAQGHPLTQAQLDTVTAATVAFFSHPLVGSFQHITGLGILAKKLQAWVDDLSGASDSDILDPNSKYTVGKFNSVYPGNRYRVFLSTQPIKQSQQEGRCVYTSGLAGVPEIELDGWSLDDGVTPVTWLYSAWLADHVANPPPTADYFVMDRDADGNWQDRAASSELVQAGLQNLALLIKKRGDHILDQGGANIQLPFFFNGQSPNAEGKNFLALKPSENIQLLSMVIELAGLEASLDQYAAQSTRSTPIDAGLTDVGLSDP